MALRRAVFIDKDGTLVEDVPYNVDPDRIRLAPGAGEALGALVAAGFELVVVSNQPGVALGKFIEGALRLVETRIRGLLAPYGVPIAAFQWCPHHPEGRVRGYDVACTCRKPRPGLLQTAAAKRGLDLTQSWMVGDILDDIEAGRRAGCRTILLDVGHETEWEPGAMREPHHKARDLREAAALIVSAGAAYGAREALR